MGCADHAMTMDRLAELGDMATRLSGQVDGLKSSLKKQIPRPINWYLAMANSTTLDTRAAPIQTSNVILVHRIKFTVTTPATLTLSGMYGPVSFNVSPGGQDIIFAELEGVGFLFRNTDFMTLVQTSAGSIMLMVIGEDLPDLNLW